MQWAQLWDKLRKKNLFGAIILGRREYFNKKGTMESYTGISEPSVLVVLVLWFVSKS